MTIYFLTILFQFFTGFTGPIAKQIAPHLVKMAASASSDTVVNILSPILAVLISLIVIYILGILGTFVVGRRILAAGEHFIENLPLIKGIYGTTKQVIGVFRAGGGGQGFQRVVLIEFPRVGIWTVGFVTNTITDEASGEKFICVFIPMTPNPTSGFFQMFPEDQVRDTDWTVEQGIKMVLSGGLLAPTDLSLANPKAPV